MTYIKYDIYFYPYPEEKLVLWAHICVVLSFRNPQYTALSRTESKENSCCFASVVKLTG